MQSSSAAPALKHRWRYTGPVLVLILALFVAVLIIDDPAAQEEFGFVGMLLGLSTASVMFFRRSRSLNGRERNAWRSFGWSLALATTGVVATGAWALVIGDPPAFGFHDLFFLAAYAMLAITLLRLARSDASGANWTTTILDALVGGVALGALVWAGFIHDLMATFESAPVWQAVVGFLYPVLDIAVVVGVMVLVIRRSHYHFDMRLVFLAGGLIFQVLADFVYFSRGVGRTFSEAQPAWGLLIVGAAFWVLVGSIVDKTPAKREFPEQVASLWALAWPYLLAAALLATHVVRYRSSVSDRDDVLLLDALIVIGLMVFVRQLVEIHRNRKYVEERRTQLVSSVSHELRTPLTAMVGYLTLLDEESDDFPESARVEMISAATQQAKHMNRLVSDLVMLARGDRSELPIQLSDHPIRSLVDAALRNVESGTNRIDQETVDEAIVRVDADRVQQALSNLLSNALRYGGGQTLLVVVTSDQDLVLEVHDNGPGVPTKYQAVIWQRFERGVHRFDAVTPGLGIGLAIVQAVASSHGGTASYRPSERLGGACFSVMIPGCVLSGPLEETPQSSRVTSTQTR